MPIETHRVLSRRRAVTLAVASLYSLGVASCATQTGASDPRPLRPSPEPMLLFDNASTESVRVYLAEYGSRRQIGYVQAGRQALLRLPITFAAARTRQFTLVVLPLGAQVQLGTASAAPPGPIESEPLPGNYIAATRWRFVGRQLLGFPLPR